MNWQLLIKDLRKEMLLSQEDMADKLGVAFCTVNRYENGHYEPTFRIQRQLKKMVKSNKLDWNKYKKGE